MRFLSSTSISPKRFKPLPFPIAQYSSPTSWKEPGTTVAGDTVLGLSDNRGALQLAAIGNASISWPATGGLASGTMSLGDYVAQIVGAQSDLKNAADSERTYRSDVSEEVSARRSSVEGVNLDEELANMMVFQQAYNASARLLTTVQQMYDTLLDVV